MLETVITAVATILATVPDAGNVHTYLRRAQTEDELVALLTDGAGNVSPYWAITRESTAAADIYVNQSHDDHTIVVRGHMIVTDTGDAATATEPQFRALIEAVRDAFRANRTLKVNNVAAAFDSQPMQVRLQSYANFMNRLIHYVELVLVVRDFPLTTGG